MMRIQENGEIEGRDVREILNTKTKILPSFHKNMDYFHFSSSLELWIF